MAYKALYRTYRPRNFDEVVGQQYIVKTLKNAIETNKIAHAYLFCGPRGTGKTSIAKIFSMAINCTAEHNKPCLTCESCQTFLSGEHPDVIEIDAASNNGVDEVRDLIEKVKYAPISGAYKIYIIDEVHMMTTSAFNALLKTIEEPPKHVIFILATTDPHKVIPTIISRCQRYDFTSVSIPEIKKRVVEVMNSESITYEEGVPERVAMLSDGGMRDSLSILDQCIAYAGSHIALADIDLVYSAVSSKDISSFLNGIALNNIVESMKYAEDFVSKGVDMKRLFVDMISFIKNVIYYSYTNDLTYVGRHMEENTKDLLQNTSVSTLLGYSDILVEASEHIKNTVDISTHFELTVLKLLNVSRETMHVDTMVKADSTTIQSKTTEKESMPVVKESIEKEKHVQLEDNSIQVFENSITTSNTEDDIAKPNDTNEVEEVNLAANKEEETNSNVSRETQEESTRLEGIENSKEVIEMEELDEEFYLRLLVSANKDEKEKDKSNFNRLNIYINDLDWIKEANLLRTVDITASGKDFVLLRTKNRLDTEVLRDKREDKRFLRFVKELLQEDKHVFVMSDKDTKELIETFKKLMVEGGLPEQISFGHALKDDEIEQVDEGLQRVLDVFGEENVKVEE